jgi:type VI secretion system secreted protein VgrG
MSVTYLQAASSLQVTTPLGANKLLLKRFSGSEYMSLPFLFILDMDCTDDSADPTAVLGQGVTVTLIDGADNSRYIHGLVTRLTVDGTLWQAELRPWLWMLNLATDSKIFQNKSVTDIITGVFSALGFTDYKLATTASYSPLVYCVQYQETAFNFVCRLMEQFGIWYYFEHANGTHTMVLADDPSAIAACTNAASVEYLELAPDKSWLQDVRVQSAALLQSVATAKFQSTDFNFITPSTSLTSKAAGSTGTMQVYDYPGLYQAKGDGDSIASLRLQEFAAPMKLLAGTSTVRPFAAGTKFTMTGHPASALNADWALREVSHSAERNAYSNSFTAFPAATPFRPPRSAVKPRIAGTQTAMVVGKSGEEIWTDQYGRIKVQFHWDLIGTNDENSSCWIRVAQSWAGKSWGAFILPRIGQEVVVSFLEGDPDQPLVTGCVYNGDFPVPYALPDFQTRSVLKSNSSKGGGGSNELCFEDKAGSEEVYFHAQKDLIAVIESSRTTTINSADDTLTVAKGNRSETISQGNDTLAIDQGNRSVTIGQGNDSLTVSQGNRTVAISQGNESVTIGGTRSITVTGNETLTSKANATWNVTGDFTLKVSGNVTIQAGGTLTLKSGTDLALQAGTQFTLKGAASGTVDGGGMLAVKGGIVQIN